VEKEKKPFSWFCIGLEGSRPRAGFRAGLGEALRNGSGPSVEACRGGHVSGGEEEQTLSPLPATLQLTLGVLPVGTLRQQETVQAVQGGGVTVSGKKCLSRSIASARGGSGGATALGCCSCSRGLEEPAGPWRCRSWGLKLASSVLVQSYLQYVFLNLLTQLWKSSISSL